MGFIPEPLRRAWKGVEFGGDVQFLYSILSWTNTKVSSVIASLGSAWLFVGGVLIPIAVGIVLWLILSYFEGRDKTPKSHMVGIASGDNSHDGSKDIGLSLLHLEITAQKNFGETQFCAYLIYQHFRGGLSGEVPVNWQSPGSAKGERNVRLEPKTPRLLVLFKRGGNGDAFLMHQNYMEGHEGPRKLDSGAYSFFVRLKPDDKLGKVWESDKYLLNIPQAGTDNINADFRFRRLL